MKKMTLQETLKQNKENIRNKRQEQLRRLKREQRKETILTIVIAGFIMIATLTMLSNTNDRFMNDCMNAGHSQTYCERGM